VVFFSVFPRLTGSRKTHIDPVQVEDETGQITRVCIHVNGGPSDNPMQSEISSHIGGKGNHMCRKCDAGGTQKEKATNEGYHALFEVRFSTIHAEKYIFNFSLF
jgi:hypothetical protein